MNKSEVHVKLNECADNMVAQKDYNKKLSSIKSFYKKAFQDQASINKYLTIEYNRKFQDASKIKKIITDFCDLLKIYEVLGNAEFIKSMMESQGVSISQIKPLLTVSQDKKIKKDWGKRFNSEMSINEKEIIEKLSGESLNLMKSVEAIKEETDGIIDSVMTTQGVSKSTFSKAAKIRAKQLEDKDTTKDIQKIHNESNEIDELIEIIEGG